MSRLNLHTLLMGSVCACLATTAHGSPDAKSVSEGPIPGGASRLARAENASTPGSPAIPSAINAADTDEVFLSIERFVNSLGQPALDEFIRTRLDGDYVENTDRKALLDLLERIRKSCRNPGGVMIHPGESEGEVLMEFESSGARWKVGFTLSAEAPGRIRDLSLTPGVAPEPIAPFTWETTADRLRQYEAEGFAGSVLLVRGGEIFLNEGYGLANEALGARNGKDTIYAIGSTPIDFTHVSILLLEECGKLRTGDLLSRYVEGVPPDKAGITLAHLMTGRSGLRNFHGIRGVDENLDLSYIDREEALRRILGSPLLFAPGTGYEHSHSAWGVLAAVVEIVSGETYGDFVRTNLLEPAGMERTGLYPHSLRFADEVVAVGQGEPTLGLPNSPKHWGPTSWLVMGSGGMVSTTQDFYRWMQALRAGKILSEEQLRKFFKGTILSGGNDRGFMTLYTEGPENLVILCSNSSVDMDDLSWGIGYALAEMVRGVPSRR